MSTVPITNNGLPVSGGPANLAFSRPSSFTGPTPSGGGSVTATTASRFPDVSKAARSLAR